MDIVLFGIQGSGKGTLGKFLVKKYNLKLFETGSELRKLSQEESELSRTVKSIVESGKLVPNEVVMELIERFMLDVKPDEAALFDGIPRQSVQAETFDTLMKKLKREFTGIYLDVPEEVAIERLSSRRLCAKCKLVYPASYGKNTCENCHTPLTTRSDDNPESIKTRLKAFYEETVPVIERYKREGKMIIMNGNQSIEKAQAEIDKIVEKIQ